MARIDTHSPRIGINADLVSSGSALRHCVREEYVQAVIRAGGIPIILPVSATAGAETLSQLDGIVLTGGGDIHTQLMGIALHEKAECMHPQRQSADFSLLTALDSCPNMPVLGICLGMQEMGVHAGGRLIQHIHDVLPDGDRHGGDQLHPVTTDFGCGTIASWHHQVLADAGTMIAAGTSDDGLLEAIRHPTRPFYVGVQWHPERTKDELLGLGMFKRLIEAARAYAAMQR
ncbi:MAG: gamma-glutamyl-gamma-aminobutyrate hydrolase family protein [Planctomycetota bacterium]|nr:gamma-glutamyl-gamma-aminobutyrate hydrolase family protein [Planctomycetota bacterium]